MGCHRRETTVGSFGKAHRRAIATIEMVENVSSRPVAVPVCSTMFMHLTINDHGVRGMWTIWPGLVGLPFIFAI